MVGDEAFIEEVRQYNSNSLSTLLGGTLKVFALFFYGLAIFITFVVASSVIIAGFAVALQAFIYIYANSLMLSDYLIIGGLVAIGVGIILVGLAIIKSTLRMSESIKLYIVRKTKLLFRKKEGVNYE